MNNKLYENDLCAFIFKKLHSFYSICCLDTKRFWREFEEIQFLNLKKKTKWYIMLETYFNNVVGVNLKLPLLGAMFLFNLIIKDIVLSPIVWEYWSFNLVCIVLIRAIIEPYVPLF